MAEQKDNVFTPNKEQDECIKNLNGNQKVCEVKLSFPINSTELSVPVTDEDCKEVFEMFKGFVNKIEHAEFEPTHNPDACKYCPYTSFCGLNII